MRLLTNDRANLGLAKDAGVSAMSIHSYVKSLQEQYPDLSERMSPDASQQMDGVNSSKDGQESVTKGGNQRHHVFQEHKRMSELTNGIRQGR